MVDAQTIHDEQIRLRTELESLRRQHEELQREVAQKDQPGDKRDNGDKKDDGDKQDKNNKEEKRKSRRSLRSPERATGSRVILWQSSSDPLDSSSY